MTDRPDSDLLIRALNVAWVNLHWLHTDNPQRYPLALAVLEDAHAPDRTERAEDAGIRSKGGISDPTGEAATSTVSDLIQQRRELTDLSAMISDTASFIRETVTRALYDTELTGRPTSPAQAMNDVTYVLTAPHTARHGHHAWTVSGHPAHADELTHAVDLLYRQTSTLRTLVRNTLARSVRPPSEKPKQPKRLSCEDCARHGVQSDVAEGSKKRCPKCLRWRKEYPGVAPTATMVRSWADGRERLTPGMIAEAIAASAPKRKRQAS